MTMWGGRFEQGPDPLFKRFNDSLPFDKRLVAHDIQGSIAWARALHDAGVLDAAEQKKICSALHEIAEFAAASPESLDDAQEEDVHSWVEVQLIERVGDLGKKLHTGRSRNDQVTTDLRLYNREQLHLRITEIRNAQLALITLAERNIDTALPGYTHLQRAQPVLFAHWCMAYVEMLERDACRFADAMARANICPLGSAALAGTAYRIDRDALAAALGFDRPTANSLDAVADRDFVLESLAASVTCAIHLSRLAEDLVLYASGEFGFLELDEATSSGSSIMPQKKNPDALELIRGKAGRILGSHTSLAMTLKGLPLAYNKDMQEDKEPLFDAMDHLSMCLLILVRVLDGLGVRSDQTQAAAQGGYANATELADYLAQRGVPFREAHEHVGRLVRMAIEHGKPLEELTLEQMHEVAPTIQDDIYEKLSLQATLAKRDVVGGTAPNRVRKAVSAARLHVQAAVSSEGTK